MRYHLPTFTLPGYSSPMRLLRRLCLTLTLTLLVCAPVAAQQSTQAIRADRLGLR